MVFGISIFDLPKLNYVRWLIINWKESKRISETKGIILEEDCWIGANSLILPQVNIIGKGAIIVQGVLFQRM